MKSSVKLTTDMWSRALVQPLAYCFISEIRTTESHTHLLDNLIALSLSLSPLLPARVILSINTSYSAVVVVDEFPFRHFRDEASLPDVSVTYDDHLLRVFPAVLHSSCRS